MSKLRFLIPSLISRTPLGAPQAEPAQRPPADLALLPPPAVWSRVLIWTLGAGSMGLLLWSVLTKVEETVVLVGEVTTEKPGVQVSPLDPGVITAVNVKPHQAVSVGEVLMTYADDDTDGRLASQLRRRDLLRSQQAKEQVIFELRCRQVEEQIALDRDILQRLVRLRDVGAIQETQVLEKRAQVSKGELSLSSLKEEMSRSKSQSDQQLEDISQLVRELEAKQKRFVIKSPVTGFVQEIRYQSVGERIQPSEVVSVIVPSQALNARVRVPSKLSAPLDVETPALVDVDAFPASDYGSVRALVSSVSPTTSQGSSQSPEKTYAAELRLVAAQNPQKLQLSALRPGMAVTAKVRLREKPVIATVFDFLADLFDPLHQQR
ncbi:MAG: HlyD family efflux transporter periplasmic adaptor subunit [Cyanobacteria bacterium K_DeepCast_35m_m2_023]|nr:HlyD family efflux transporter periplasmic adaptor subunit [Cyanobacteria bacterium K_DeepCast_35m_m2_023]